MVVVLLIFPGHRLLLVCENIDLEEVTPRWGELVGDGDPIGGTGVAHVAT